MVLQRSISLLGESIKSKVKQTLDHLEERPVITDYWRVGQQTSKKISPIKLSVKNTDIVYQILRKAKRLKDIDGYKTV